MSNVHHYTPVPVMAKQCRNIGTKQKYLTLCLKGEEIKTFKYGSYVRVTYDH